MTTSDSDVRAALQRVTHHLDSPPALLDDVRRGGRRRLVRRRTVLGAGTAVAVAAVTAGVVQWRGPGAPMDVASPLLDGPTRGDLVGDRAFLDRVRAVWAARVRESDVGVYGEPHVLWAGGTQAGPAAFVIQRTAANPVVTYPDGDRLFALCTFVHTTRDGLRSMDIIQMSDGSTDGVPQAALLGEQFDVLLVVDFGAPVWLSRELTYAPDARVVRDFQPIAFHDGAAVVRVAPQGQRISVALARQPLTSRDKVHVTNAMTILSALRKDGDGGRRAVHRLPGAERAWSSTSGTEEASLRSLYEQAIGPYVDQIGDHVGGADTSPIVYGATPDGRRLVMDTYQYLGEPARHVLFLAPVDGPFTAVAGVVATNGQRAPIRLRLPDRQGTLVVVDGAALRYRVGTDPWQDAGRDAALLPPEATQAEFTRPGASPELTTL